MNFWDFITALIFIPFCNNHCRFQTCHSRNGQVLRLYIRVSNEAWLLKVRGVFWALCKVLYSVCCPFGLFHRLERGEGELFEVFTARSFPWTDGVLGIGYNFNGTIWPCTSLVSRSCHSGAVANVDFEPCRSRRTDGYVGLSDEAKIVRTGTERRKIFSGRPEKGTNGLWL